jgi:hypothetical protein
VQRKGGVFDFGQFNEEEIRDIDPAMELAKTFLCDFGSEDVDNLFSSRLP